RSGRRPVEEVEDEQLRPVLDELRYRERFVGSEEDRDVRDAIAGLEHPGNLTTPTIGDLEPRTELVRAGELLVDVADRSHVRAGDEKPLVGGRPVDEEPAAVRRPREVAEVAGPRKHQ